MAWHYNGWFALCSPEDYPALRATIDGFAEAAGRRSSDIGAERGVGIHGRSEAEWTSIVKAREATGVSHLCMRTLGGGLDAQGHLAALKHLRSVLDARCRAPEGSRLRRGSQAVGAPRVASARAATRAG